MEKSGAATTAAILCFLLLSAAAVVTVSADAADCIDGCFTGCVQRDVRLMQRCEGKCRIRCGPDNEVEDFIH